MKSIGQYAFSRCTGLTSITIPNSVTEIGSDAFYGCTGLKSITTPNFMTEMGGSAFWGTSPNDVYINILDFEKNNVSLNGNNYHYIYEGKEIKGAFTIPDSVTSIGKRAFYGCMELTSITIPNSVKSIEDYAFYKCNNISTIVSLMPTPPSDYSRQTHTKIEHLFSSEMFYGTLYVPVGSLSAYRENSCWNQFYDIIEGIPDDIDKIFTLSVGASNGGNLSFLGKTVEGGTTSMTVESGSNVTLSIIPNEGYRVVSLVINGNDVTADMVDDKYTIEDINEDTSVVATFRLKSLIETKMDTNDDGEVNSADVVRIYNYIINGE